MATQRMSDLIFPTSLDHLHDANSSNKPFASFRPSVSKPSVNHP